MPRQQIRFRPSRGPGRRALEDFDDFGDRTPFKNFLKDAFNPEGLAKVGPATMARNAWQQTMRRFDFASIHLQKPWLRHSGNHGNTTGPVFEHFEDLLKELDLKEIQDFILPGQRFFIPKRAEKPVSQSVPAPDYLEIGVCWMPYDESEHMLNDEFTLDLATRDYVLRLSFVQLREHNYLSSMNNEMEAPVGPFQFRRIDLRDGIQCLRFEVDEDKIPTDLQDHLLNTVRKTVAGLRENKPDIADKIRKKLDPVAHYLHERLQYDSKARTCDHLTPDELGPAPDFRPK